MSTAAETPPSSRTEAPGRKSGFARLAWLPALVAVVLALIAAASVLLPPAPAPADAPVTEFSAERAKTVIDTLADEPHSVLDREAHDRARDDVVAMFTDLGYEPQVHTHPMYNMDDPVSRKEFEAKPPGLREPLKDLQSESVVVEVPGKSERTMALMAHYDSAFSVDTSAKNPDDWTFTPGESHGAADDGYGVATIVEALRALRAEGRQPENSLRIVITDAEEVGLNGAYNELAHHRSEYDDVELILNLEARGMSGPALMFETSAENSALIDFFLGSTSRPATASLMPAVYQKMPNGTDMSVFLPEGFTVLNIAAIGEGDHYHDRTDAPDYVSLPTVQHYGDQVLELTRAWAFDPGGPDLKADADAYFFPLWRGLTVRYPQAVGLALGAAAVIAALVAVGLRARTLRWKQVLGTVWGLTWRTVMAAALAWGAQLAAAALGWAPPALYPIGPNPLRSWIFAAGMLLGAGLVLRMLIKHWRAGSGPEAMAAVLLLLALASAALLVVFPGASYVMVLTTLALMAVWLTPARGRAWTAVPAAFLIVVVFAPVLWFMHEALSLTAMWATVFMAITPVAPLTLVLMSAGWPQDGQAPRTTSPASAAKALA